MNTPPVFSRVSARPFAAALVAVAAIVAFCAPAAAQTSNATMVTSLPFEQKVSAVAVAGEPGAPSACAPAPAHAVWYELRLPHDASVEIDTVSSSYDTVLDVFLAPVYGEAQHLACNDDEPQVPADPPITSSRLRLEAQEAVTYLVRAASRDGAAGNLSVRFAAYESKSMTERVQRDAMTVRLQSGAAVLEGVSRCNKPLNLRLRGSLTQRTPAPASASVSVVVTCSGDSTWSVVFSPPPGQRFVPGRAELSFRTSVCDLGAICLGYSYDSAVQLLHVTV